LVRHRDKRKKKKKKPRRRRRRKKVLFGNMSIFVAECQTGLFLLADSSFNVLLLSRRPRSCMRPP
jgi:hypothetical protein